MGCCSSSESGQGNGRRQGPSLMPHPHGEGLGIPHLENIASEKNPISNDGDGRARPKERVTTGGHTKEEIYAVLKHLAGYLAEKKQNITLVTMGGIVDTVLLQVVPATNDLFLYKDFTDETEKSVVQQAMDWAKDGPGANGIRLGEALNKQTIVSAIGTDSLGGLYRRASKEGTIVFQAKGLTVVSVPLAYSFIMVANRLGTRGEKPLDLNSAVAYLRGVILSNSGPSPPTSIPEAAVRNICDSYNKRSTDPRELQRVNGQYRWIFGRDGVRPK